MHVYYHSQVPGFLGIPTIRSPTIASREVMVFLARPVLGFAVAALLSLGLRYGAGEHGKE